MPCRRCVISIRRCGCAGVGFYGPFCRWARSRKRRCRSPGGHGDMGECRWCQGRRRSAQPWEPIQASSPPPSLSGSDKDTCAIFWTAPRTLSSGFTRESAHHARGGARYLHVPPHAPPPNRPARAAMPKEAGGAMPNGPPPPEGSTGTSAPLSSTRHPPPLQVRRTCAHARTHGLIPTLWHSDACSHACMLCFGVGRGVWRTRRCQRRIGS